MVLVSKRLNNITLSLEVESQVSASYSEEESAVCSYNRGSSSVRINPQRFCKPTWQVDNRRYKVQETTHKSWDKDKSAFICRKRVVEAVVQITGYNASQQDQVV